MIQIIRTKNARMNEINARFDGKQARKKFSEFSGNRLTMHHKCGIIEAHQGEQKGDIENGKEMVFESH